MINTSKPIGGTFEFTLSGVCPQCHQEYQAKGMVAYDATQGDYSCPYCQHEMVIIFNRSEPQ